MVAGVVAFCHLEWPIVNLFFSIANMDWKAHDGRGDQCRSFTNSIPLKLSLDQEISGEVAAEAAVADVVTFPKPTEHLEKETSRSPSRSKGRSLPCLLERCSRLPCQVVMKYWPTFPARCASVSSDLSSVIK